MNASVSEMEYRGSGLWNTEPYHIEKYIMPGAVAVTLLFIFPWYLLGGGTLGGVDLGTALLATLVAGHLIESLKVYQWGPMVRKNFGRFNKSTEDLLSAVQIERGARERARTLLFSQLNPSESSEFAWNLVRWQKMTVVAVILCLNTIEWLLFAVLAVLQWKHLNPFAATFQLVLFRKEVPLYWSVVSEVIAAGLMLLAAYFIYRYGLDRQNRNNNFFLELFQKHRRDIVDTLKKEERPDKKA